MNPSDYFEKHNLSFSNLVAADKPSANLVYLTDEFVLRVVRPELAAYINHEREATIGLKAFELGIKTAKPVAWDKTYSIWERIPGQPLSNPETCSNEVWQDLFDNLELLHKNLLELLNDPLEAWKGDVELVDKTQDAAQWSTQEKEQLQRFLSEPHPIKAPCFIHGDAYADNIMIENGHFVGLIDWGNARWQSLEAECSSLDTPALKLALQRWHTMLDMALLWKLRLNLSLEVASYGRIPISSVREVLNQLIDTIKG